ncbi:MAG: DALR domain-containing protein, partial [Gemmatimonadota bacterium]
MDDDLNVSDARGAIFELVRRANGRLDEAGDRLTAEGRDAVLGALEDFDRVFGVLSLRERERSAIPDELRSWVEARLEERAEARERGEYERADEIRDEIEERGIQVEDAPDGSTRWKLREGEFVAAGA